MTAKESKWFDLLAQKRSATSGHPVLSEEEVKQLSFACDGWIPGPLDKKVTKTFSGEEIPLKDPSGNCLAERRTIGAINYFTQNVSKPVLIEQQADWLKWHGRFETVFVHNVDDMVAKIKDMSAEDYYDLVFRIALFLADHQDMSDYLRYNDEHSGQSES